MALLDYLFVDTSVEFLCLALIVFIGGIVRGCIGFGFSALVVASTILWLDVKYTVVMMVFLETVASLFMFNKVKQEIKYDLLKMIVITGGIASFLGVWVLVNIDPVWHQWLLSIYLMFVALVSLFQYEFKKPVNNTRLNITGFIAGFYNGLAASGGIFIALMLVSSKFKIKNIRSTIVLYFFITEAVFFVAAYINDLVTKEVVITSLVLCIPMLIGIFFGSKLFASLSENILKQIVLFALLLFAIAGLVKVSL